MRPRLGQQSKSAQSGLQTALFKTLGYALGLPRIGQFVYGPIRRALDQGDIRSRKQWAHARCSGGSYSRYFRFHFVSSLFDAAFTLQISGPIAIGLTNLVLARLVPGVS